MPINSFDNYPMSWKPSLKPGGDPLYIAIAKRLEEDIRSGTLSPGTKLPPQRELADYLDVNLSTISRALKRCEQKGIICSSIGSGTFVSSDVAVNTVLLPDREGPGRIELGAIFPDPYANGDVARYLQRMTAEPDFGRLFQYGLPDGTQWQKEAAVSWIGRSGYRPSPQSILLGAGGQNAIAAVLAGLFRPGDRIGVDSLTYPGIKTAATMLGIQLVALGEISEDSVRFACKSVPLKGLYVIPDYHNPTTNTMPPEVRQRIARAAEELDLLIIEDGINGMLREDPLPPIAAFAPDHTIHIASLSKSILPGLRLSFIAVPERRRKTLHVALYNMNIAVSPILAELAARMIQDGTAERILQKRRAYTRTQNEVVNRHLAGFPVHGDPECNFRWLLLPEHFTGESFELCAYHAGVQVYAAERFAVGNEKPPRAVRLAVTAPKNREELSEAMGILRSLLEQDVDDERMY